MRFGAVLQTDGVPTWVYRLRAVGEIEGLDAVDAAIMLAAVQWANDAGNLWPSVETWGAAARLGRRAMQTRLRGLEAAGVIVRKKQAAATGRALSNIYHIPCFVVGRTPVYSAHGDAQGGRMAVRGEGAPRCAVGAHGGAPKQQEELPEEKKKITTTTTSPVDAQPLSGDAVVVASLIGGRKGEEMVRHKNATPELLAWIVSNASEKDNPGGWAVEAIRTPYEPSNGRQRQMLKAANRPPPTPSLVIFGAKPGDSPPKYGEGIKRTPEEIEELRQIIATHKKGKAK